MRVMVERAVGVVGRIPGLGRVAWYGDHVGEVDEVPGHPWIRGVETHISVGYKVVAIYLGSKRLGSKTPDSCFVLLHGDRLGHAVQGHGDAGCSGILVVEGDGPVGIDLRRVEVRWRLCDQQSGSEQETEFEGGTRAGEVHTRQFS